MKKTLFWVVWLLAAPFVFLFFCLRWRGSLRAQITYWKSGLPWLKTALVRQSVWEKLVQRKTIQRELGRFYRRRP